MLNTGVKRRIVVVGRISMNILAEVDKFPNSGETIIGKDVFFIPGGKGANQAVAASRLGGVVSFITRVGTDDFGKSLYAYLQKEKLDMKGVTFTGDAPTGISIIEVDKNSYNRIISVPGSDMRLSIGDLDSIKFTGNDIIISQLAIHQEVIQELFMRAKAAGATIILNATPLVKVQKGIFELADYVILNANEAAFFSESMIIPKDVQSAFECGKRVRASHEQVVIVTLGADGCIALDKNDIVRVEATKVDAIDSTGAGDAFVGGFATALSEGKGLEKALRFASKAGAITVKTLGASTSLPYREAVDNLV